MAAKSKPRQRSAELLADFKQYTMAHPKLTAMHDQVLRAIREPAGASLIFILGPTGVVVKSGSPTRQTDQSQLEARKPRLPPDKGSKTTG